MKVYLCRYFNTRTEINDNETINKQSMNLDRIQPLRKRVAKEVNAVDYKDGVLKPLKNLNNSSLNSIGQDKEKDNETHKRTRITLTRTDQNDNPSDDEGKP